MSVSFKQYTKYNQKLWKFQCYLGKTEFGEEVRTTRSGFQTKKKHNKFIDNYNLILIKVR